MDPPACQRLSRVNPHVITRLRSLRVSDVAIIAELIDWLEAVDPDMLDSEAAAALADFADVYDEACELEALNADKDAIAFVWACAIRLLAIAQHAAESDDEPIEPVMSRDEFRRLHIDPVVAEGRRVVRAMNRRYRVPHGRVRGARGCGHRRRARALRSSARSGDSGEDDPLGEPPGSRRRRRVREAVAR